jgi:hypothetical protein
MRPSILIIWTILLLGLSGCEKVADISSPVIYEKENISFSYPRNWKVTEDVKQQNFRYLFIESPGSAIFMVQVYSKNDAVPFDVFVEWFSSTNRDDTPVVLNIGKSTFSTVEESKFSPDFKGIKENFSMTLLGEQMPYKREYFTISSNNKVAFLVAQAATEDLSKVEPGFDLILNSFVIE